MTSARAPMSLSPDLEDRLTGRPFVRGVFLRPAAADTVIPFRKRLLLLLSVFMPVIVWWCLNRLPDTTLDGPPSSQTTGELLKTEVVEASSREVGLHAAPPPVVSRHEEIEVSPDEEDADEGARSLRTKTGLPDASLRREDPVVQSQAAPALRFRRGVQLPGGDPELPGLATLDGQGAAAGGAARIQQRRGASGSGSEGLDPASLGDADGRSPSGLAAAGPLRTRDVGRGGLVPSAADVWEAAKHAQSCRGSGVAGATEVRRMSATLRGAWPIAPGVRGGWRVVSSGSETCAGNAAGTVICVSPEAGGAMDVSVGGPGADEYATVEVALRTFSVIVGAS